MIPISDDNPTRSFPWLTIALILVNVAVFAYTLQLPPEARLAFVERNALVPTRLLADPSPAQLLTGLYATFMHAGWLHIGFNMLYLWIFGNNVEDRFGHFGFALFYLTAGAGAFALQLAFTPDLAVPFLGASGAVAGVLGAYAVLYPRARVLIAIPILVFVELARLPAIFVIGFWFVTQLFHGVGSIAPGAMQSGGVAYLAHVGGFLTGALIATPLALLGSRRSRFVGWR